MLVLHFAKSRDVTSLLKWVYTFGSFDARLSDLLLTCSFSHLLESFRHFTLSYFTQCYVTWYRAQPFETKLISSMHHCAVWCWAKSLDITTRYSSTRSCLILFFVWIVCEFVSFAAVFRGVTQRSPKGGALRDIPKDGCEGDYLPVKAELIAMSLDCWTVSRSSST